MNRQRARLAKLIWTQKRLISGLPFAHRLYAFLVASYFRNGAEVVIPRGPAAGLRWRHYRDYQPWMAMGLYEPHVTQLISEHLRPGDVFYDVGANAGYFTVVAARAVGPQGLVVAFDPVPRNAATILEQVKLNTLETICTVERIAIADQDGAAKFTVTTRNANSHLEAITITHAVEGRCVALDVATTRLDTIIRTHRRPTLVKMDIEGAEVLALQGARELLAGPDAPTMLISTHSDTLERKVKAILIDAGYSLTNLSGFEQMVWALPRSARQTTVTRQVHA